MSVAALQQAKSEAVAAKARFLATLGETQHRLTPGKLAGEAWSGVKGKTAQAAGSAVGAVKQRPVTVSLVLGGLVLFLARAPIRRAVTGLLARKGSAGNEGED